MSHTVYVLKSLKDGNLYIGCTKDLGKRFLEHNQGKVKSTKSRRPFNLILAKIFPEKIEAFKAERFYKTAVGKRQLNKEIDCRLV